MTNELTRACDALLQVLPRRRMSIEKVVAELYPKGHHINDIRGAISCLVDDGVIILTDSLNVKFPGRGK